MFALDYVYFLDSFLGGLAFISYKYQTLGNSVPHLFSAGLAQVCLNLSFIIYTYSVLDLPSDYSLSAITFNNNNSVPFDPFFASFCKVWVGHYSPGSLCIVVQYPRGSYFLM